MNKRRKREYIMRKQAELGVNDIPDEVISEFVLKYLGGGWRDYDE